MYNPIRIMKTSKRAVFTVIGAAIALTMLLTACPQDPPPGPTGPSSPTNLVVEISDGQAELSWDAVSGAAEYRIYRAAPDGTLTRIAENTTIIDTTFTDTGLTNGTIYRYVVRAVDSSGLESGDSEEINATPAPTPPPVPKNFTATPGDTQVLLSWTASNSALEYQVYRADTPTGDLARIAVDTTITETRYIDTGLTNGTAYRYTVRAVNALGDSAHSSEAPAVPVIATAPPSASANLSATAGDAQVSLSWDAVLGATEYRLFRADTPTGDLTRIDAGTAITETRYIDADVENGTTYRYTVRAVNRVNVGPDSSEATATPALAAPAAPGNLSTAPGIAEVSLSWDAVGNAATYQVYRADTPNGDFTRIADGLTGTTYTDTGLEHDTAYRYTVRAVNAAGISTDSAEVSATTRPLPGVPGNLRATGGIAQISLSWDAVTGAIEYRLFRADTANGDFTRIASGATITETTYTDTELDNGTTYRYTVRVIDAVGESPSSTEASATTRPLPGAPANLTATGGIASVSLSWDAVTGATEYRLFRADTADGDFARIASGAAITETTYTDTELDNGTAYRYTVRVIDAVGESPSSTEVSATTRPLPGAPANLTATGGIASVSLSWDAVTGAIEYRLFRADTANGDFTRIASGATITETTYTDTELDNGTTYRYTVRVIDAVGESPSSTEASATTRPLPAVPANLTATGGIASVSLSWDTVADATSYRVYRANTPNGTLSRIASNTTITETTYTDTGLANNAAYRYTVRAVNAVGESASSTETSATTRPLPVAPANLTATPSAAAGNGEATLSWDAVAGATEYRVYRASTSNGTLSRVAVNTIITATTYTDIGLATNTTYRYAVRTVDPVGESASSTEASVTTPTPLAAPANLTATAGISQVVLAWDAVTGADEYRIYRRRDSAFVFVTRIATDTTITTTTYTDTSASGGTTYGYTVRAANTAGESQNSSEARVSVPSTPRAPRNLNAAVGDTQIFLSWNAVGNASEYRIFRATSTGTLTRIASASTITENIYTDTGLTNGTTYRYVVRALNVVGESGNSNETSATPVGATTAPLKPANLRVIGGNTQARLSWDAVDGAAEYRVFRGSTRIATLTALTYTDTGLTNLTTYRYTVRAANAVGVSFDSLEVSVIPEDHTNDRPGATPVTLGTAVSGTIDTSRDLDYFAVTITANPLSTVTITATTTGTTDTSGSILDGTNRLPLSRDLNSGEGTNFRVSATVMVSGTYYIEVEGWAGSTGSYSLTVTTTVNAGTLDDHSNTADGATPVTSGVGAPGTIDPSGDVDYFSIAVTGASPSTPVTITATTTGTTDTNGALFNSSGGQLAINEDIVQANRNFRIIRTVTQNGTYYVRVRAYQNTTGAYTLSVTAQ